MRTLITFAIFLCLSFPALAAPRTYVVDKASSKVGFGYSLGSQKLRGQFQSYDIDLVIDFQTVANSSVSVRMDATSARTPLPFAAEALRGPSVLDVDNFPTITFQSETVTGSGNKARLNGVATIKGVTKPLVLTAELFRPKGSSPVNLDDLILQISGRLDRREFGADGFINEVSPFLIIDIRARVSGK